MIWQRASLLPPPGYAYGPRYRASIENILRGIVYISRGRPRSLAHDALFAVAGMPVPPLVRGADSIPENGPFVIAANHYERPGLWMAWPAILVSHLVQERAGAGPHWVAIEEWEDFSIRGVPIPRSVTRAVFERTFRVYGIIAMPPPDAPAAARASALRDAARSVREGAIVGLMPEGTVGSTPELLPAREGVGSFLALLSAAGAAVVPLGIYEEDGHLVAHFGSPIALAIPRGLPRAELDRQIRDRVMVAIRDLLPPPLWGAYRDTGSPVP